MKWYNHFMEIRRIVSIVCCFFVLILWSGCTSQEVTIPTSTLPFIPTVTDSATVPIAQILPTLTPTPYPYFEPAGCFQPEDEYSLVEINGWTINQRTFSMLQHASVLFNGDADYLPSLITQGSYHDNGAASWGTHLGGGAIDLSVMLPGTYTVDSTNIARMIRSLRAAGFAAWLRDTNELFSGSSLHIHAIAVGDAQLSQPALDQLVSEEGYFFGFNGIPVDNGSPLPDRHGNPVVCNWMIASGYSGPDQTLEPRQPWQLRLIETAQELITSNEDQTQSIADQLNFYPGTVRGMEDLDGPLAIWMLHESKILLPEDSPVFQYTYFRLGNLDSEWRFWMQFPVSDYTRFDIPEPAGSFDFTTWPLLAGDVVITNNSGKYTHLFVVTEVDDTGKAFTVAPVRQEDSSVLIQKALLYDPGNREKGLLKNSWSGCELAECKNEGGLTILRRPDLHLAPGTPLEHLVQSGDTIPHIALQYDSQIDAIITANPGVVPEKLEPGYSLTVPVNILDAEN
jgi:hypothetical protein